MHFAFGVGHLERFNELGAEGVPIRLGAQLVDQSLQLIGHGVDGAGELAHFIIADHGAADGQVAAGQGAGGIAQPAQGAPHGAPDQRDQCTGERCGQDDRGNDQALSGDGRLRGLQFGGGGAAAEEDGAGVVETAQLPERIAEL